MTKSSNGNTDAKTNLLGVLAASVVMFAISYLLSRNVVLSLACAIAAGLGIAVVAEIERSRRS